MTAQTQPEALRRVQAYIARLKQSQRIDRECISVFDGGAPSEVLLLTSDIEWMVAQIREKRQPLSKERRNQIECSNTIQGYHGDYYDAYGIIDDVEAAHNITGEPT